MSNQNRVIIIVPTYNENGNIEDLIETLETKIFPSISSEFEMNILIVDDNSPDGTAKTVSEEQKKYKNLFLLNNPEKIGLGNAYTKGMEYATNKLHADIVFEFDADFSHDPNKIKPMLSLLTKGNDMVLGSRYVKGGSIPSDWGLHRKFLSIFGNFFIRLIMADFTVHDWTTGYRAIKREVVDTVLPELNDEKFMGYTFQIGFLHKSRKKGYKVAEVPIQFIDRTKGKSKLGSEYIKNTLHYILKVRYQEIIHGRLTKFIAVGIIGALLQLGSLTILRSFFSYQLAYFLSVEAAVMSNFLFSNLWTFSDRKLSPKDIPSKFIQFNLASSGSIIIQQALALIGENTIGLIYLFTLPLIHFRIDSGLIFAITGIFIGMFWNFFAYSKIIWRAKKK